MRSITFTLVVFFFSAMTTIFQMSGVFPVMNYGAASAINQGTINQLTMVQTVSSGESYGAVGYFNIGIRILTSIIGIVVGTLAVAVPLVNAGVPWYIAAFLIQPALYAIVAVDQLMFWRGIQW